MRAAYYVAYDEANREVLPLPDPEVLLKRELVSAAFVVPTPPGFPILVPGQVITQDELTYLKAVKIREIVVFRDVVLKDSTT